MSLDFRGLFETANLGDFHFFIGIFMFQKKLEEAFRDKHQFRDTFDNDGVALIARIFYVQDHEELRSFPILFFPRW